MANVIRYKTSQPTKRGLRKGNTVVGIGEENYGPTSTTGYVNGITPPDGGYVIYTLSSNNDPAIYVANNDDDLPAIARTLGGGELDYLAAKNYLDSRSNTWILDNTPKNTITDGLVLDLNAKNISSFLDNKPIENLVPSGARTGDSALPRQSYHIRAWTYSIEQNFVGRDSVIKLYINPPGTDSTAPYADYGFYAYKSGGSQVGDVYTISMDYYVAKGNSSPAITIAYANGYKNPTSAQAASWGSATITDLGNGWYRRTQSATITIAGNTWWRGGLGSNNIETEAYIDNIQIELNSVATPFVDGTRSQNTTWKDISGYGNNGTLTNGPTFENGAIVFDGVDDYIALGNLNSNIYNISLLVYLDSDVTSATTSTGLFHYGGSGASLQSGVSFGATTGFLTNETLTILNENPGATYQRTGIFDTIPAGWRYISFNWNGSSYDIYIDGDTKTTSAGSSAGHAPLMIASNFILASNFNGTPEFEGKIASVKIYDQALDNSEIQQNYYGGPIVTDSLQLCVDAANLVSYESGSTTTYDMLKRDEGDGYGSYDSNGTLTNGVVFNTMKGGTWDFDGVDDYISFGTQAFQYQYDDAFSLEVWCNPDTLSGFKHLIGVTYASYRLAHSSDTITFRLDANTITTAGATLTVGEWSHVIATWDPTTQTARVYKNGVLVTSVTNTNCNWTSQGTDFRIASSPGENYYFDGKIPIGRVYNKTLSDLEALQNYNAQKARFGL